MPSEPNKIPRSRWQNLKDNVSIVEVIEYLTEKALGFDTMIKCPLHDDRTPSMKVSIEHNGARCFGLCDRWFDPISFWATYQNVRPITALLDLEKLFKVKWDGIDRDDDMGDLSPFETLSSAFLLDFHAAELPHLERMKRRERYWLARHEGQDVIALKRLMDQEKADRIISKWREENDV
jgi:hypothetical protein